MPVTPLTKQQWVDELEVAISGFGSSSHWRVSKVTVEQSSPMCHAELADTVAGKVRSVIVARDRFGTTAARIAEITRQVQLNVEPRPYDGGRFDPPRRRGDA